MIHIFFLKTFLFFEYIFIFIFIESSIKVTDLNTLPKHKQLNLLKQGEMSVYAQNFCFLWCHLKVKNAAAFITIFFLQP